MPRFVTLGYGDEADYRRTPQPALDAAHANDAALKGEGALLGRAGAPVQVRNPDGSGTRTEPGPFLTSALPLAGFGVIEAADLEAAIEMVARSPCAVAHGVVEVWPLEE